MGDKKSFASARKPPAASSMASSTTACQDGKAIAKMDNIAPLDPVVHWRMADRLLFLFKQMGYVPPSLAQRRPDREIITLVCARCGENFLAIKQSTSRAKYCNSCKRY